MNRSRLCSSCQGTVTQHEAFCSAMTRDQREVVVNYWIREVDRLEKELKAARRALYRAEAHADKAETA